MLHHTCNPGSLLTINLTPLHVLRVFYIPEKCESFLTKPGPLLLCCNVSPDFKMRCPQGRKNKLYKRAKLEKFAHFLIKDGLGSPSTQTGNVRDDFTATCDM